jgi:hypothetical protein
MSQSSPSKFSKLLIVIVVTASIGVLLGVVLSTEGPFIFDTILVHPKPYLNFLAMLTGIFLVLTVASLLGWVILRLRFPKRRELYPPMLILVTILSFGLCSIPVFLVRIESDLIISGQTILQRTPFANHFYYLIDHSGTSYTGDVDLRFFECDAQDIFCRQLHQIKLSYTDPKSQEINSSPKSLLIDPATNTITLQINGESVYMYPVK